MKTKILLTSAGAVGFATVNGIVAAIVVTDPIIITRLTVVSGILGLASVGLFFVGLAYPKGN